MHKGFRLLFSELYAELYFLITAKFIDFVADVILKALHVFLVDTEVEQVDDEVVGNLRFNYSKRVRYIMFYNRSLHHFIQKL